MPKRLKNIDVEFISLVASPATGLPLILKNQEAKATLFKLEKADEDRQVAYGVVYAPGVLDAQGEFTDQYEIEAAAYRFMKAKRVDRVDQNHDFQPLDGVYVAESWLVKAGDPWFGELPGSWAVGVKVDDKDVWERLQKGELWGFSMAGQAEREEVTPPEDTPDAGEPPEDTPDAGKPMVKADLDVLLAGLKASLAAQIQDAMAPLVGLPEHLENMQQRLSAVEKARLTVSHQPATGPAHKPSPLRQIF